MKKITKYGIITALATPLFIGCADETPKGFLGFDENAKTIAFRIGTADSEAYVQSRAGENGADDIVKNIYTFFYKITPQGSVRIGSYRSVINSAGTELETNQSTNDYWAPVNDYGNKNDVRDGSIRKTTFEYGFDSNIGKGDSIHVYSIANVGFSSPDVMSSSVDALVNKGNVTEEELRALILTYGNEFNPFRTGAPLMSDFQALRLTGRATPGNAQGQEVVDLKLKRVEARVDFKFFKGPKVNKVVIRKWRLVNVPRSSTLFDFNTATNEYMTDNNWVSVAEEVSSENNRGSFTFYTFENKKKAKVEMDIAAYNRMTGENLQNSADFTAAKKYRLREYQEKKSKEGRFVENGEFVFPEANAEYVEIIADIVGKDENGNTYYSTDTKMTVHMGYATKPGQTEADIKDYNVLRNGHYTYNITINGLNNIEQEVIVNNELPNNHNEYDSGIEGDVVKASSYNEVDAHYTRLYIAIPWNTLRNNYFKNGKWNIRFDYNASTPFDKFGKKDVNWVHFYISDRWANHVSDDMGKYTNQIYTPAEFTRRLNEWFKSNTTGNPDGGFVKWGPDNSLVIYAFVDEYYYESLPTGIDYYPSFTYRDGNNHITEKLNATTWSKNGWRTFVNQPDRIFNFFFAEQNETVHRISSDTKSSLQSSKVYGTIRQSSIFAPYNLENLPKDFIGFGSERKDETYGAQHQTVSRASGSDTGDGHNVRGLDNPYSFDGRDVWLSQNDNGLGLIDNPTSDNLANWDVFKPLNNQRIAKYVSGFKTPLIRNMGWWTAGNGYVMKDADFRWYLPSMRQLYALWMADDELPIDERMTVVAQGDRMRPYLSTTQTEPSGTDQNENFMYLRPDIAGAMKRNYSRFLDEKMSGFESYYMNSSSGDDSGGYYTGTDVNQRYALVRSVRTLGGTYYGEHRSHPQSAIGIYVVNYGWNGQTNSQPIALDLSTLPASVSRGNFLERGMLYQYDSKGNRSGSVDNKSNWSKPYRGLRIAKMSAVLAGKGKFRFNDLLANKYCRDYSEDANGGDRGRWRVPTGRELLIMIESIPVTGKLDGHPIAYNLANNGYASERNKLYSSGYIYRNGTYYHIFGSTFQDNQYGLRLINKDTFKTYDFDVRCVRDISDNEMRQIKNPANGWVKVN